MNIFRKAKFFFLDICLPFTLNINLKCLGPTKPALTTTAKKIHKHEAD